jgi:hypothetical protein
VGALDELLVEPVELVELGVLDELEQAARPPTAMAAAASAATRFDALGMDIFLLVSQLRSRDGQPAAAVASRDDCLPTERFCGNRRGIHTKIQVVARL